MIAEEGVGARRARRGNTRVVFPLRAQHGPHPFWRNPYGRWVFCRSAALPVQGKALGHGPALAPGGYGRTPIVM